MLDLPHENDNPTTHVYFAANASLEAKSMA